MDSGGGFSIQPDPIAAAAVLAIEKKVGPFEISSPPNLGVPPY